MNEPSGIEPRVAKLEALAQSTDQRLSSIEQDLRELRTNQRSDFRLTWAGLIAGFLITWAGLSSGIIWVALKLNGLELLLTKALH